MPDRYNSLYKALFDPGGGQSDILSQMELVCPQEYKKYYGKRGGALMMQYDRITLGYQAMELNFVRDVFKKVRHLEEV